VRRYVRKRLSRSAPTGSTWNAAVYTIAVIFMHGLPDMRPKLVTLVSL
jgi:hypothetical protein